MKNNEIIVVCNSMFFEKIYYIAKANFSMDVERQKKKQREHERAIQLSRWGRMWTAGEV